MNDTNHEDCFFYFDGVCYDDFPVFYKVAVVATWLTMLVWYVFIAVLILQAVFR